MLLVTGPNGKCHQTAEIKNSTSTRTHLLSDRFLRGLAITQDVEDLLSVALELPEEARATRPELAEMPFKNNTTRKNSREANLPNSGRYF